MYYFVNIKHCLVNIELNSLIKINWGCLRIICVHRIRVSWTKSSMSRSKKNSIWKNLIVLVYANYFYLNRLTSIWHLVSWWKIEHILGTRLMGISFKHMTAVMGVHLAQGEAVFFWHFEWGNWNGIPESTNLVVNGFALLQIWDLSLP